MDRTNVRHTKEQYSMQFKLINKRTKEVVDTVEVFKTEKQIAAEYFQNKKQLNKESFDKLYEVKKDDRS